MSENIKDIKNLSFEEALVELENIVRELESGKIKLEGGQVGQHVPQWRRRCSL